MEKIENNRQTSTPMLFPIAQEQFWQKLRMLVREEVSQLGGRPSPPPVFNTPGFTYKPLYKIKEVCELFEVTKPTIYDWIKHGKLKPYKIRSRVYFLWNDIQGLLKPEDHQEY